MAFTPTDWQDGVAGGTPITAAELNRMEQGIVDGQNTAAAWADVTGKPATFPPTVGTTATTALAGNTSIPAAPAAGTAAQLTAGTDTVQRTWSAKMIADEIARQIAAIPAE